MRLLHISDFHASPSTDYESSIVLQAFFADIDELHSEKAIDVVAFTGDLTQRAMPEEFELARHRLIQPLLERLGLSPENLLLVPGNHDVDRNLIDRLDERSLQHVMDRDELNEHLASDADVERLTSRLSPYRKFADEFGPAPRTQTTLGRTVHLESEGETISISLLNTAWRASGAENDSDRRLLFIGEREIRAHLETTESAAISLALFHHPVEWLAEFDAADTKALLEENFDIVLTGHTHKSDSLLVVAPNGRTVYSRAGCLFESRKQPVSFTTLDLDVRDRQGELSVRLMPSGASRFVDEATLPFDIGTSSRVAGLPIQPKYSTVLDRLADHLRSRSILGDHLPAVGNAPLDDLVVTPCLMPVPYEQWARMRDADDQLDDARIEETLVAETTAVLTVVGDRETGLTTTLVWLAARRFQHDPTRLPLLVSTADIGAGQHAIRTAVESAAKAAGYGSVPERLTIAIDDVHHLSSRPLGRLIAFILDNPTHDYILGLDRELDAALADRLESAGLNWRRCFVGPFGRKELKTLVHRLAPDANPGFVNRILRILHSENLPRTPFLMAAMIAVVATGAPMTQLGGQTAVLQRYVRLLLGSANLAEDSRFGLDETNRERLLAAFAGALVREQLTSLSRQRCERFFLDYFDDVGWENQPAGPTVDALLARRVLVDVRGDISFRHDAFHDLFVARQMQSDRELFEELMRQPLDHKESVAHLASLVRGDRELLLAIADTFETEYKPLEDDSPVSLFESVQVEPGFSNTDDLDQLAAVNVAHYPNSSKELDRFEDRAWEEAEVKKQLEDGDELDDSVVDEDMSRFPEALELLSQVLRSSEHVDDAALKQEMLSRVLQGWGWMLVYMAVNEDKTGYARDLAKDLLRVVGSDIDLDKDVDKDRLNHLVQLMLAGGLSAAVTSSVGTQKLGGALRANLDDDAFMDAAAPALLGTLLYCDLRLKEWTSRLRLLLERHQGHSVIREVLRYYARYYYYVLDLPRPAERDLEAVVVDSTLASSKYANAGPEQRQDVANKVREGLRSGRLQHRLQGTVSDLELEDGAG